MLTKIKFEKIIHPHPLIEGMRGDGVDISKVEFRLIKRSTASASDVVGLNNYTNELLDKARRSFSNTTWRTIILCHFSSPGDYMIAGGEWFYRAIPYTYVWVFGQDMLWNGEHFLDKNDEMMWDSCNIKFVISSLARLVENNHAL